MSNADLLAPAPGGLTFLSGGGPLAVIGAALRDRLQAAFPPAKFVHQAMPARISKRVWETFVQRLPAIGLGLIELRPDPRNGRVYQGEAAWAVYLANANTSPGALVFGDAIAPGQLAMAQMALAALHGWTIEGAGTVQAGRAQNSFSDEWATDNIGLVMVELAVPFRLEDRDAVASLDDFLNMGVAWPIADLPPAPVDLPVDLIEVRI